MIRAAKKEEVDHQEQTDDFCHGVFSSLFLKNNRGGLWINLVGKDAK